MLNKKLESIKNYISNGDIKIAIDELSVYLQSTKDYFHKGVYQRLDKTCSNLSSRYLQLKRKDQKGELLLDTYQKEIAQIISSALDLIFEIGDELSNSSETPVSEKIVDGFTKINSEESTRLAIEKIKEARSMKVIGMGRQDVAEATSSNHVLDYYDAIEKRFKDPENPFSIKRVTQHRLKPKFTKHLKTCFQIVKDQDEQLNKYDLVLYGDLKITYTYYIINSVTDESSLFLTLSTENLATDSIDNSLVLFTTNSDIINTFNDHFDQFWAIESKLGRKISTVENFDRYVPFDANLYKQYTEVKYLIKKIPDDSVRMKHLKTEMDTFHRRLTGLNDCIMNYKHTSANQRLTSCFKDYFEDLREGQKSYRTISFPQFWESMSHIPTLIEKQAIALANGAKMERILLLDSSKLDDYTNNRALQIAIPRNYLHHRKYDNYCFSILFSSDPEEMRNRDNIAIWNDENIDYKVLFDMKYGQDSESNTKVYFANYKLKEIEKTDMRKNQNIIDEKERDFSFLKDRVIDQYEEFTEYLLAPKDSDKQLSTEYKSIQRKIEFLKNFGVDDILTFFQKCTVKN